MAPISSSMPPAAVDPAGRLMQAARQLEAQFLQQLLKSAEPAEDQAPALLDEGPGGSTWRQMRSEALADRAAGSLGIAEAVFRELAAKAGLDRAHRHPPTLPPPMPEPKP